MKTFKIGFALVVVVILAVFCTIQGAMLVRGDDPLIQMVGFALLLTVPSCAYFAWRGCMQLSESRAAAQPEMQPSQAKVASRIAA
jgi:hypothetical protein